MAKSKKQDDSIDVLEDPNAIVEKANEFFENKRNRNILFVVVGVIALIVVGIVGYNYYNTERNNSAQEELFQAQFYFEADSSGLALNGDGNSYGFLEIIDEFSGTKAANLANFYAGASYMKLKDFESAIRHLEEFGSSDLLLQARAYSLIGDAYMEMDDFGNAIDAYEDAATYKPNEAFTPIYLKKLALALELDGQTAESAKIYSQIVSEYPKSTLINDAKKNKARLEAM